MTVTCTNTKHVYPADGKRTTWPFTFPLFNAQDLRLWRVGADGKAVLKTSGYEVDMQEKEVLYPLSQEEEPAPPAGEYIVLQRATPLTQELDIKRQQTLDLQTWEDAHDLAVMRQQELAEELSRALKFPVHSQPDDTDAQSYLTAITELKEQAQTTSQQALEISAQAKESSQEARLVSSQAVQEAQAVKGQMEQYVSSAQSAQAAAVQAQTQAQTAQVQAQNYAQTAQQADVSVQAAAQTVAEQSQQAVSSAHSAQQNAQTAQTAAQEAKSAQAAAQQSAQEAAQSASTINPSTYVPKAGGTMTGSLTLQDTELFRKTTSFAQGDVPEKDVYLGLQRWRDKDNKDLVVDYTYANTTGNIQYIKRMWQNTAGSSTYRDIISLFYSPAGVSQVSFEKNTNVRVPTPQSSSNSTDAATTAWVRSLLSGQSLIGDYVVSHYMDDAGNWYRVYKSGWVEQGGVVPRITTSQQLAISLLKPFANTNYHILVSLKTDDDEYRTGRSLSIAKTLTSTSFTVVSNGWSSDYNGATGFWRACGQGA